jgi:vacuolar-type H+-ATPase subunit I/STV1
MYPRTITIENKKLQDLLFKKADLVNVGRATTDEITKLEEEMVEVDKKLQEEEKKVDIADINEKQKEIGARVDKAIEEMKVLQQEIYDRMLAQTSPELRTQYDELKKKKEDKEEERNKVALKVQKYNDKIIPLAREMMKPFLEDQYEDYDSLYVENGEIVATIFSHLNDFKNNFKKK